MFRSSLIGYSGFVGSNLLRQRTFEDCYRSTNIAEIRGKSYDLTVCCGVSAAKWKANKEPELDLAAIRSLLDHLLTIRSKQFVLISTVDVYPVATGVDETFDCTQIANHAYGRNRLYLEMELRKTFPNLSVIRLPGLFGPGLKKNVIFDLLHDNCLEMINPSSVFQYYDMNGINADMETVLRHEVPLLNLVTEPIATSNIHERFFSEKTVGQSASPEARYDIHTRHAGLFGRNGKYRYDAAAVLTQLESYIASETAGAAD